MRSRRAKLCQNQLIALGCLAMIAAGLLGAPHSARACSGRAYGYWLIADSWPATTGAELPSQGVVVGKLSPWGPGAQSQGIWPHPTDADMAISVTTAAGDEVEGRAERFGSVTIWRANRALETGSRYVAHWVTTNKREQPPDVPGPTELELEFTAVEGSYAPLTLTREPRVALERAAVDLKTCGSLKVMVPPQHSPPQLRKQIPDHDCDFFSCLAKVDRAQATLARVELGSIDGGQESAGHLVRVVVTADVPFDFDAPPSDPPRSIAEAEIHVLAGREQTFNVMLPERAEDYRACVQLRVTDVDGRTLDWQGPCTSIREALPQHVSGCSVVAPGQTRKSPRSPAWYWLIAFLALTSLRSARRY